LNLLWPADLTGDVAFEVEMPLISLLELFPCGKL